MTPDQVRAYFGRWALVREVEETELRRAPIADKLRQLASLMASRGLFEPAPDRDAGVRAVRERWAHLRQVFGG